MVAALGIVGWRSLLLGQVSVMRFREGIQELRLYLFLDAGFVHRLGDWEET